MWGEVRPVGAGLQRRMFEQLSVDDSENLVCCDFTSQGDRCDIWAVFIRLSKCMPVVLVVLPDPDFLVGGCNGHQRLTAGIEQSGRDGLC